MPFINLIADQRALLRTRARIARTWFFAFITVTGLSALSFVFLLIRSESLNGEIRSLEAQLQELKPFKDAINRNQQLLATLKPRMDTLKQARLDTQRWSRIFDHISLVLPNNTWLTSVNAQQAGDFAKPAEVAWTGMTTDQTLVGDFMLRMQKSSDLQNVQLRYTETKTGSYGQGIEFQIASEVAGTEEAPVKAPAGSVKS